MLSTEGGSQNSKDMGSKKLKKSDISLSMECCDDILSPCQMAALTKSKQDFHEISNILNILMSKFDGEVISKGEITIYQLNNMCQNDSMVSSNPASPGSLLPNIPTNSTNLASSQNQVGPILQTPSSSGYQFIVEPRLGLLMSPSSSGNPKAPKTSTPVSGTAVTNSNKTAITQPNKPCIVPRPLKALSAPSPPTSSVQKQTPSPVAISNIRSTASSTPVGVKTKIKQKVMPLPASNTTTVIRPEISTPTNSLLRKSNQPSALPQVKSQKSSTVVDLTSEESKSNGDSDSREMIFSKVSGKTFPSLVVIARPNLHLKEIPQTSIVQERKTLDAEVKSVLMYSPTKFAEWLIQQGLVSSEQHCSVHVYPDLSPVKLKLGMYSEVTKFPFSGGYVWISDCCPSRFVSIFTDSIFEGAPHPPTVTLKLIYHWACQTSVANVVQWVKVDNLYVKNFYTNMRAVCTASVHDKLGKLGGPRKRIEVGVISLGTTSADGQMRQVKVEVLGVMDPDSKQVFLRAVEPTQDGERNYKRRFSKILEHLETWVHKNSIILTDFTVDKGTLTSMGYNSVFQVSINDASNATNKYSNYNIMEYLRRIVPRMFQNTLSLLSRNIIQQFLDELVWRELYGPTAARAFNKIVAHIAEQTKMKPGTDNFVTRLSKIAANPFRNWAYSALYANPPPAGINLQSKAIVPDPKIQPSGIDLLPASITQIDHSTFIANKQPIKRKKSLNGLGPEVKKITLGEPPTTGPFVSKAVDLQPLTPFYYGSFKGNAEIISQQEKVDLNMKCCSCKKVFNNNLSLMMHLIVHAINTDVYNPDLSRLDPICKYCLKTFSSEFNLASHIEFVHSKTDNHLKCLICEDRMKDRSGLILHMHRTHCELELPYECGVCFYRTSEHKKIIDHFYEKHDNSGKIQCPLCLKIIAFKTNDKNISKNMYFFLAHIQKHHRKSLARKCEKCALWFVHKGILKEHREKDHTSYAKIEGVERYEATLDCVMMPRPLPDSHITTPKVTKAKLLEATGFKSFTMNKFYSLTLQNIPKEAACCECEGYLLGEDHFTGYLSCILCPFSTCCNKAMWEHSVVFHNNKLSFHIGTPIILEAPMYCVCGFKSKSGNKLAKHLATCKKKSAYPSEERAARNTVLSQSASFPPLVTLDDPDTEGDLSKKWLQAYIKPNESADKPSTPKSNPTEPPSMLNMLGLVRKDISDETSSKSSEDKVDSPCIDDSIDKDSAANDGSSSDVSLKSDKTENSVKAPLGKINKIRIKTLSKDDSKYEISNVESDSLEEINSAVESIKEEMC